jgi:hypothetical protein
MEGDSSQTHDGHLSASQKGDDPRTHHDALEFPDGRMVLLTHLLEGQEATVLQLPPQPVTAAETKAQKPIRNVR